MSSAPHAAPSSAPHATPSAAAEVPCPPEIAEVRKGFFRWIGLTLKNTALGITDAISAVTWRPTKYVFRKAYNIVTWPANYVNGRWEFLQTTKLGNAVKKGTAHALDSESYRLFGAAHGAHGGGEAEHH